MPTNVTSIIDDFPVANQFYGPLYQGKSTLGGSKDDWGYSLQQTRDIGLILAGQTRSFGHGGSDMWLIKTGLTPYYLDNVQKGVFQAEKWNITFGGSADDGAYSVIQTADNGFLVAGFTASFGAGGTDMCLIKTDFDGKIQWYKTYGGSGDECAYSVIQTGDGAGYLLSGYTTSGVSSKSSWIVKTDLYGNELWNMVLPGSSANVAIVAQDGYALAVESSGGFRLVTTGSTGNVLIDQTYPVSGQASTQAIVQADDGGYALAGWSNTKTGTNDGLLIKTDSAGQKEWSQTYPGIGIYGLIKTSKGGYALTGDHAALIITDFSGNLQWNEKYEERELSGSLTRMQSIIEATPDHFVMDGVANSYRESDCKQLQWMYVTLKSGEQLVPPKISPIQPESNVYTSRDVPVTYYVDKPIKEHTLVSINGFNFTIDGNTTLKNLPNGNYKLTLGVTDANANHAYSQTISFTVDSKEPYQGPQVTIISPENNATYNDTNIRLNFTVNGQIYSASYSLDGQEKKGAYSGNYIQLGRGTHVLTVYANDITGTQTGSATVTFFVNASSPWTQYPSSSSSTPYYGAVNQLVQAAVQAATSEVFLVTVAIVFAVAIGIVVVFLILIKRNGGSKQNKQSRMVR